MKTMKSVECNFLINVLRVAAASFVKARLMIKCQLPMSDDIMMSFCWEE